MNAEITEVQKMIWNVYDAQKQFLAKKPKQFLEDLLHEAEELQHCETFTIRTSAEINRAACLAALGRLQ